MAPDCQDDRMNMNFLGALASILRQSDEYNEANFMDNSPLSRHRGIYVPSHGVSWMRTSSRKPAREARLGDTITGLAAENLDTAVGDEL